MEDATEKKQPTKTPWVPIAKDALQLLPKDRPYTELEALFSLALDHNNGKPVTVMGYSKLWRWSRKKVQGFLRRVGLEISYPLDTRHAQRQSGRLTVEPPGADQGTEKGQIPFIDFKQLQSNGSRKGADQGAQLTRRIKKEKKEKEKDPRIRVFTSLFSELFRKRFGKDYLITNYRKVGGQVRSLLKLDLSWEDLQYITIEFLLDEDPFLTEKAGHNVGTLLAKTGQNSYRQYQEAEFRQDNRHNIITEAGERAYPEETSE